MGWDLRLAVRLVTVAALLCLSSREALGQWPTGLSVEETPHNLTVPAQSLDGDMIGLIEDYGQVCTYCHAPHGGATDRPLWNRFTPTGPYRMYDDGTNMIMDSQPTDNSLACLSCHDGTIGLDDVLITPVDFTGSPAGTLIDECEDCHSGGSPAGGLDWEGVWLDTDLRKQHPISIIYDPSRDPGFRPAAQIQAAGLELYNGRVQCMTCHEPHTQQFRPFLRIPQGNSLCLTCHISMPGENTAHFW